MATCLFTCCVGEAHIGLANIDHGSDSWPHGIRSVLAISHTIVVLVDETRDELGSHVLRAMSPNNLGPRARSLVVLPHVSEVGLALLAAEAVPVALVGADAIAHHSRSEASEVRRNVRALAASVTPGLILRGKGVSMSTDY
jgi:hypothetical protein